MFMEMMGVIVAVMSVMVATVCRC